MERISNISFISATVLFISFFVLAYGASSQKECFICNSLQDNNAACLDPFNISTTYVTRRNCSSDYVCSKVSYYYRNISVVSRNCDSPDVCNVDSTGYTNWKCSTCSTNLCNSENTVVSSVLILFSGLFLIKFLL